MTRYKQNRRLAYLITSPKGFLTDLWAGNAAWSCAAQQAIDSGMAWLDLTTAKQKCAECQALLPEVLLSLTLVEFIKEGSSWKPIHQQGAKL